MARTLPTIDEVKQAAESVYRVMRPTPQYCWPLLCERLGTEVWVKHENQTPTGSFKARTAVVYVEELIKREPGTRGLVSATRGNHGQSVALAAKRFGLPAVKNIHRFASNRALFFSERVIGPAEELLTRCSPSRKF